MGLAKNLATAYKAIKHVLNIVLNIVHLLAGTLAQWSEYCLISTIPICLELTFL